MKTPVILLTSKELVMTSRSFDLSELSEIKPVPRVSGEIIEPFLTYQYGKDLVPAYIPVGNDKYRIRLNSSTHNKEGMIGKNDPESMANTKRLNDKFIDRINEFTFYELDHQAESKKLIVSYGISAEACRDAVSHIRRSEEKISLLIVKTLLPVPPEVVEIINRYPDVVFVEENLNGIYCDIIYGQNIPAGVKKVNKIGNMISPYEIIKTLKS